MEQEQLSGAFVGAVLDEFPEWQQFLRGVEFEIPQPGTGRSLRLSSDEKEITIAFDRWHTHIGPFLGLSIEETVATVMDMITGFVTEERLVQVAERDGKWLHSGLCYRVAPGRVEPNTTVTTYSWLGTYDGVVETP